MEKSRIQQLSEQYLDGTLLPEDWAELKGYLLKDGDEAIEGALMTALTEKNYEPADPLVLNRIIKNVMAAEAIQDAPVRTVHRIHFLRKWGWAAASIVLLLGVAGYLWFSKHEKNIEPVAVIVDTEEIQPGRNGAILTLADGSRVSLDSIQNGVIALQGGVKAKVVNGTLLYEGQGQEMLYNVMSTPKGRQFQVTLPDGTGVWLNAASSIRYPTAFAGAERKVEITGEVYFEVKKDIRPFIVSADNRAEVTVLGTSFNVNSYSNEAGVKATLLEGAVQVSKGTHNVIIKPGEQADVQQTIKVTKGVDLEKVMAWKAGLFNFENVSLVEAMRQLERWYDIDVVYEKGIPNIELEGEMSKDITLNGLMNVLKELGVRYKLDGRRLTILP